MLTGAGDDVTVTPHHGKKSVHPSQQFLRTLLFKLATLRVCAFRYDVQACHKNGEDGTSVPNILQNDQYMPLKQTRETHLDRIFLRREHVLFQHYIHQDDW